MMKTKNLSTKYQKSTVFEDVLNSLNTQLNLSQGQLYEADLEDQLSVHIIGSPRSGTTLLSQLTLSSINVGYINNFIAVFWNAPLYGIHLSKKLLGENYISDLESDFGRTKNMQEPHEFGYFWKKQLNYNNHLQQTYNSSHKIDWKNLKSDLDQMCYAFNKPILFKSFLYGFHLKEAVEKIPKSLFIYIERDLYQNAFSILKLREKMFDDQTVWASMKPHQYSFLKDENRYRQIIGQVLFLNYEYKKQLALIPETNKLVIEYSKLCSQTETVIKQVYNKINHFEKVDFLSDTASTISEKIVDIPDEILQEFKKAEEWLISNFSELK